MNDTCKKMRKAEGEKNNIKVSVLDRFARGKKENEMNDNLVTAFLHKP